MKKIILFSLIFFILLGNLGLACTIYPTAETLEDMSIGESKSYSLLLLYDNETIDLSSTSSLISFSKTHYVFTDSGSLLINFTISTNSDTYSGQNTININADSDNTDCSATRTVNVMSSKGININMVGVPCQGKMIMLECTDKINGNPLKSGTAIIYSSDGDLIGTGTLKITDGYSQPIIIPDNENYGITVKISSPGYDSTTASFPLLAKCQSGKTFSDDRQLYMMLPVKNYIITEGPITIMPLIKTNESSQKDSTCLYTGPIQGSEKTNDIGFCSINITEPGTYKIWAEKPEYFSSDIMEINITKAAEPVEPEPEKDTMTVVLLVNGFTDYENINTDDKIRIRLLNSNGEIYQISLKASIITPTSKEWYSEITNGIGEEFAPTEKGVFSITIPETEDTFQVSRSFEAKGLEFNTVWVYGIVGIIIVSVGAWYVFKRKKGIGFRTNPPVGDGEEYLSK